MASSGHPDYGDPGTDEHPGGPEQPGGPGVDKPWIFFETDHPERFLEGIYSTERYITFEDRQYPNLLGFYVFEGLYQSARQSNLEGPPTDLWSAQLTASLPIRDGFSLGSEFNVAKNPGREGSYHRNDRIIYHFQLETLSSTIMVYHESKRAGESIKALLPQVMIRTTELLMTYGYESIHVLLNIGCKFHAYKCNLGAEELESLSDEGWQTTFLHITDPRASYEWDKFVRSVKDACNLL
ncbi:hypothetical protein V8C42DRAFT_336831 [Trichoderma barbatum]